MIQVGGMQVRTPPTVAFSGMVLVWNLGIISTKQALGGFSNAGLLAVGVLFVVVQVYPAPKVDGGVPRTQAARYRTVWQPEWHLCATLGRSQDVCNGPWFPVDGERCVVSS